MKIGGGNVYGTTSLNLGVGLTNLTLGPVKLGVGGIFLGNAPQLPLTAEKLNKYEFSPNYERSYYDASGVWRSAFSHSSKGSSIPGLVAVSGELGIASWLQASILWRHQSYGGVLADGTQLSFNDEVYDWGLAAFPKNIFGSQFSFLPDAVTVKAIQKEQAIEGFISSIATPHFPLLKLVSFGRTDVLDRFFGSFYFVSPGNYVSAMFGWMSEAPNLRQLEAGLNLGAFLLPEMNSNIVGTGTIFDLSAGFRYLQFTAWEQSVFKAPASITMPMISFRGYINMGTIVIGTTIEFPLNLAFGDIFGDGGNRNLPVLLSDNFTGLSF